MSDIWTQARRAATVLRARLTGDAGDVVGTDAVVAAALANAGLGIFPRSPGDSLLSGAHAVLDRDSDAVYVRDDLSPAHRAVLIAHELAHFHLHPHYVASAEYEGSGESDAPDEAFLVGYGPRERRETEANAFARELLLPARAARHAFHEAGQSAFEIADRFGVPPSVVFRQLQTAAVEPDPAPEAAPPDPLTLDDSQRAAAEILRGPLLLGAGPGTGKTRALVARVQHLLETGAAPEEILCLTFSRKATAELRERMHRYLPASVASRVTVCTFHAFGLDLLRRYHRFAELPPRPALLSDAESFALMEDRIAGYVGGSLWFPHEPTYPLRDCLRLIGRLKEEMVTPAEASARAAATGDPKQIAVAAIYTRYEQTLREKGALDSADLVCRAVTLLEENDVARGKEREHWRHILVDEYQDVNRAGARLVRLLGGHGTGVWCVGDLRQAIYRFRGASPANVTRFMSDFPNGVRRDLAVNYRSLPPLVACFGRIAGGDAALWQANRENGPVVPRVTLALAADETAQEGGIAREILALRRDEPHARWADFAVLCRTNPQAAAIRAALTGRGVPVSGAPAPLAWLRDATVRELLLLMSLTRGASAALADRVGRILPPSLATKSTPTAFLDAALYGDVGLARGAGDPRAVRTLLTLARNFGEQSDVLTGAGEAPNTAFLRHVRRVGRLGTDPNRGDADNAGPEQDAVWVMTIHAAKGLEFPVVFVPNLSQGRFPPRSRPAVVDDGDARSLLGTDAGDDEEESRLLFVAMTRARDRLFLSLAERYDGRSAQPSPLIAPLGAIPEMVHARWVSDAVSDAAPSRSAPDMSSGTVPTPRLREPGGLPRDDHRDDGDSESESLPPVHARELEQYLRCPRRYYFETRRGYGDTRERTAYDALKKAFRAALRDRRGVPFADAWRDLSLAEGNPWRDAYRHEWEAVMRNMEDVTAVPEATRYRVELAEGAVEIAADHVAPDGTVERFSFAGSAETGRRDAINTLLFSAVPDGTPVRVRHVRTGEERALEPARHPSTRRARESHLARYNGALRGIRLNMFPAVPEEAGDCADCAYLLVCEPGDEP